MAFGSTPGAPAIILPNTRATRRKATVTLAFPGLEGLAIGTPSWDGNLRTIELDGEPWFHAGDACRILGLAFGTGRGSTSQHLGRLDWNEKRRVSRSSVDRRHPWPNTGANCVNESGLYKLIMRSDKDTARPFQDWVKR